MSESAKKGILIGVIVLAVVAVVFSVMKSSSAETPTVVKTIGGPTISEKEQALQNQKNGGANNSGVPADEAGAG